MLSNTEESDGLQDDSEDEFDWEEVEVPEHQPHLEITLQVKGKAKGNANANKKKGITHAERLLRIDCHKIHTVALIVNAQVRNKWINDPLLHARLLSLTPLYLQNAFTVIHKSRFPDHNQRGRMFEAAIRNLTEWWTNSFFEVLPEGHIRNRTFDTIQRGLEIRGLHVPDGSGVTPELDDNILQDIVDAEFEPIRSSKSLMKHALIRCGSRDLSSQLFTALCRGLGIPARLVVSAQSVPWQAGVGKPKPRYDKKSKGKGKAKAGEEEVDSTVAPDRQAETTDEDTPLSAKAKGKAKAKPVIKLRKQKDKGRVLGEPTAPAPSDPLTTPPVFWTEVFSRPDVKWFPIDPIRGIVNKRKAFDPTPSTSTAPATQPGSTSYPRPYASNPIAPRRIPRTRVENRMVYVLAFEEDGYARDVTRRYATQYGAKVAKVQGGSSAPNVGGGGRGRQMWWDEVVNTITRPYRLHRDDLEDQELEAAQLMEGMPTTMSGFKDHPLYVLARHLKQNETIHPPPPDTAEIGKFRGEPVYPRSSVVSLKTAENWMRNAGRSIIEGSQPMKMVKIRAGTVNRMRELEVLKDELRVAGQDGGEDVGSAAAEGEVMQGLYAFSQTELYVPDPVVDGKVPKNDFGNIDLYVPSMLPKGAAHIPFKGVAKIARKLGFDFAEAVTGFEFKKRRAFPIVEGIVIAAAHEAVVLEAFGEAKQEAEEKARIKQEERVLKRWTKLVHGLRIRQRLQEQYGSRSDTKTQPQQPSSSKAAANPSESIGGSKIDTSPPSHDSDDDLNDSAGGFLAGADRVVQAFHLPKNTHVILSHSDASGTSTPFRSLAPNLNEGKGTRSHRLAQELREENESEGENLDFGKFATYALEEDVDLGVGRGTEFTSGALSEEADMDMDLVVNTAPRTQIRDLNSADHDHNHTPKTMEEMAAQAALERQRQEDHARQRRQGGTQIEEEMLADVDIIVNQPQQPGEPSSRSLRGRKVLLNVNDIGKDNVNGGGNGAGQMTPLALSVGGSQAPPASAKRKRRRSVAASSKKTTSASRKARSASKGKGKGKMKKRKTYDSEVSEGMSEDYHHEDEDADAFLDLNDEDGDENDNDVEPGADFGDAPSPRKRQRPRGKSTAASTPLHGHGLAITATPVLSIVTAVTATPTNTGRTLRPRPQKTPAQLEGERKAERAFRQAVAK